MRPFEEIVAEHGAVVLWVCRGLVGADRADDVWSETFLAALRAYPRLRPDSNLRGWLVTIAHNRAVDHLRAAGRRPVPAGSLPDVAVTGAPPHETVLDDDLGAAVRALPPKQRGAVVLRYLADQSYADVAEQLGCSEAAARRSAADGIAALRARLPEGAPS
jgi:RNA polymerase sigma factor (sigma-70 family)